MLIRKDTRTASMTTECRIEESSLHFIVGSHLRESDVSMNICQLRHHPEESRIIIL